jgi:Putative adhesin
MPIAKRFSPLPLAMLLALGASACHRETSRVAGTFEFRADTAASPVILDLTNESGDAHITVGRAGEVRVHADIYIRNWSVYEAKKQAGKIINNPPIAQQGNLVRIGGNSSRRDDLSIDYTIVVPPDTEVRGMTGSGSLSVAGARGPVNLTSGKGDLAAVNIQQDVQATSGKGDLSFASVQGNIQATTGKGDIVVAAGQGEMRLRTGKGDISLAAPAAAVTAETGRGSISVAGARYDLRLQTSSGDLAVEGNPLSRSYWDFQTSRGSVDIHVPASASFRLHAHSGSGSVAATIPMVIEEKTSKHDLRARAGEGQARVDVETSSGTITVH